jgi:dCTP diphosphatase
VPIGLDATWTDKQREHLGQELSDVFIYLMRLSQQCNIDLPKVVEDKIKLNSLKYPVEKVFGQSRKYNEYE